MKIRLKNLFQQLSINLLLLSCLFTFSASAQIQNKNKDQQHNNKQQQDIALVGATIISPHLANPIDNAVVLISNGLIQSIGLASMKIDQKYQIINVSGKWLVPGYIDSHVHFFQSASAFTRPDDFNFSEISSYEEDQAWVQQNMQDTFARYLSSGITGAVDMGGPLWNFENRSKANNSLYAPTLAVAGPLISSVDSPRLDLGDKPIIKSTSAKQAVGYVQQQLKFNPDLIKIWWIRNQDLDLQDQFVMFKAAIGEAHISSVRVAIHATELETAKMAIKAGADILVHNIIDKKVDDELLQLMLKNDIIFIPTFAVFDLSEAFVKNKLDFSEFELKFANPEIINTFKTITQHKDKYPQQLQMIQKYIPYVGASKKELNALSEKEQNIVAQLSAYFPENIIQLHFDNLKAIYQAGITVALGTDAGNVGILHGASIMREMEMMNRAGLPLSAVLEAISINGAKVMGQADKTGSIEVGKFADLVVLDKNPLASVEHFKAISAVVKQGIYLSAEQIEKHIKSLNN